MHKSVMKDEKEDAKKKDRLHLQSAANGITSHADESMAQHNKLCKWGWKSLVLNRLQPS